ncbi:MAG: ABC transporter ATP-binding protein [Chloroflexi bacterium]|nr:ABC transporter ATP-binding protein [Chloroflexota bacterium]
MTYAAPSSHPIGIKVQGLAKSYGDRPVLRDLALEVAWGQRFVLFGGNGSGKTTLMKCLAGLARPDAGSIAIAGLEGQRQGAELRRCLGVVSHQPLLYEDLTGAENLRFYGRMYGVPELESRIALVGEQLKATRYLSARVRTLSHGMKKRLSLARALLHDPPVLLLDEPESGLDQEALELMDALLQSSEQARTVLMTTHNLERGLALADQAGILAGGRIAYQASTASLEATEFRRRFRRYLEVAP